LLKVENFELQNIFFGRKIFLSVKVVHPLKESGNFSHVFNKRIQTPQSSLGFDMTYQDMLESEQKSLCYVSV
jgi:hypothetical protein